MLNKNKSDNSKKIHLIDDEINTLKNEITSSLKLLEEKEINDKNILNDEILKRRKTQHQEAINLNNSIKFLHNKQENEILSINNNTDENIKKVNLNIQKLKDEEIKLNKKVIQEFVNKLELLDNEENLIIQNYEKTIDTVKRDFFYYYYNKIFTDPLFNKEKACKKNQLKLKIINLIYKKKLKINKDKKIKLENDKKLKINKLNQEITKQFNILNELLFLLSKENKHLIKICEGKYEKELLDYKYNTEYNYKILDNEIDFLNLNYSQDLEEKRKVLLNKNLKRNYQINILTNNRNYTENSSTIKTKLEKAENILELEKIKLIDNYNNNHLNKLLKDSKIIATKEKRKLDYNTSLAFKLLNINKKIEYYNYLLNISSLKCKIDILKIKKDYYNGFETLQYKKQLDLKKLSYSKNIFNADLHDILFNFKYISTIFKYIYNIASKLKDINCLSDDITMILKNYLVQIIKIYSTIKNEIITNRVKYLLDLKKDIIKSKKNATINLTYKNKKINNLITNLKDTNISYDKQITRINNELNIYKNDSKKIKNLKALKNKIIKRKKYNDKLITRSRLIKNNLNTSFISDEELKKNANYQSYEIFLNKTNKLENSILQSLESLRCNSTSSHKKCIKHFNTYYKKYINEIMWIKKDRFTDFSNEEKNVKKYFRKRLKNALFKYNHIVKKKNLITQKNYNKNSKIIKLSKIKKSKLLKIEAYKNKLIDIDTLSRLSNSKKLFFNEAKEIDSNIDLVQDNIIYLRIQSKKMLQNENHIMQEKLSNINKIFYHDKRILNKNMNHFKTIKNKEYKEKNILAKKNINEINKKYSYLSKNIKINLDKEINNLKKIYKNNKLKNIIDN